MEFKFTFSDFLLAQFKAGLHFCDVTLLQRNWNLILVSPSADPDLVAVYTSQSQHSSSSEGAKHRSGSAVRTPGKGRCTPAWDPTLQGCKTQKWTAVKKPLWISQEFWNESFDNTFTLIEESEVCKHDQIIMHWKVKKKSWILNKICFAYKDLKFCLIANQVWIIIKTY